jgi:hypothetical protein
MTLPDALWGELTQGMVPGSCPQSDEGKVRRLASRAFDCAPESTLAVAKRDDAPFRVRDGRVEVTLPESERTFALSRSSWMSTAQGEVHVILRADTTQIYEVAGCGAWGTLACVTANRSVRTEATTYENTADRLCLWGREARADEGASR